MTKYIAFILMSVLVSGCDMRGDSNLNKDGGSGENGQNCKPTGIVSSVVIEYSANSLPNTFTGNVNGGSLSIDECQLGSSTSDYTITRVSNQKMLLTLWIRKGTTIYSRYFNADGTPKTGQTVNVWLYGKNSCNSSPVFIDEIDSRLEWVKFNKASSCSSGAYTAPVK